MSSDRYPTQSEAWHNPSVREDAMVNLLGSVGKLLTRREAEIARLVATGLSNKQIARKASLSEGTVKIHLHRAYKKLGIANRSSLAVIVSSGVLPASDGADATTRRGRLGIEAYPEIGRR